MADIFISYAREDETRIRELVRGLEGQGWSIFWDRRIPAGKSWESYIGQALSEAKCVVVAWSHHSITSKWVKIEATEAEERGIIVPVLLDSVKPPLEFRGIQAADLTDWKPDESSLHFDQLIQDIIGVVGSVPHRPMPGQERTPHPTPEALTQQAFTNSIGMSFVLIPAGSFTMGSPTDDPGRNDDERQHPVTISKPFYLQTTEVTQKQWKQVMGTNPSVFKDCGDDCPVEQVSWNDALEFIRRLNEKESVNKYRLPTEAEWEYACRGGSKGRFCFGDEEAKLGEYAWCWVNSDNKTHPVGKKKPNAWGLYDMHGNVWEWCQDWYGEYPTSQVRDPIGLRAEENRVMRGGSWFMAARDIRSSLRGKGKPDCRFEDVGFRVARDL